MVLYSETKVKHITSFTNLRNVGGLKMFIIPNGLQMRSRFGYQKSWGDDCQYWLIQSDPILGQLRQVWQLRYLSQPTSLEWHGLFASFGHTQMLRLFVSPLIATCNCQVFLRTQQCKTFAIHSSHHVLHCTPQFTHRP